MFHFLLLYISLEASDEGELSVPSTFVPLEETQGRGLQGDVAATSKIKLDPFSVATIWIFGGGKRQFFKLSKSDLYLAILFDLFGMVK